MKIQKSINEEKEKGQFKNFLGPAWRRASPFGLGLPAANNPYYTRKQQPF
jgi:hypothetical protein